MCAGSRRADGPAAEAGPPNWKAGPVIEMTNAGQIASRRRERARRTHFRAGAGIISKFATMRRRKRLFRLRPETPYPPRNPCLEVFHLETLMFHPNGPNCWPSPSALATREQRPLRAARAAQSLRPSRPQCGDRRGLARARRCVAVGALRGRASLRGELILSSATVGLRRRDGRVGIVFLRRLQAAPALSRPSVRHKKSLPGCHTPAFHLVMRLRSRTTRSSRSISCAIRTSSHAWAIRPSTDGTLQPLARIHQTHKTSKH